MENCKFSVIVPTHNRPLLLDRALGSLRAQSSHVPFEIIVVSDYRDSETADVCDKWLRDCDTYVKRSGQQGPSESRNIGMRLAKGQYLLFLDDDDAWHPQLLEQLIDHDPVKQDEFVFYNCSIATELRSRNSVELISEFILDTLPRLSEEVYIKNQVHMSCFAFPRSLLDGVWFDVHMRAYEDWDFMLSVFDKQMPKHVDILGSRVFEVNDVNSDRRGSTSSANDFNAVLDYIYVYRRHPAPKRLLAEKRSNLLTRVGLPILPEYL